MRIVTLIENNISEQKNLKCEHGLSVYIETRNKNILFDTGQSGDFIENAKKLGVDLEKVNYMALSHAHYDHCGGVRRLLKEFLIKPDFYVGDTFFEHGEKYHYSETKSNLEFCGKENEYKYIGIDFDKEYIKNNGININYVKDKVVKIDEGIYLFSKFNKKNNFEKINKNMKVKIQGEYLIDEFDDEIALGIDTNKGLIVLLGCSHPGILNIIESIIDSTGKKIYGVIGGTHLIEADEDRIKKTIKKLNDMRIELIGVSHCTGENACKLFKDECSNFFENSTGTTINL